MTASGLSIVVKYSCDSCGLEKREVTVRERRPDENVVSYVRDVVAGAIGFDHMNVSPLCTATTMKNLMIPITGAEYIGQAPRN